MPVSLFSGIPDWALPVDPAQEEADHMINSQYDRYDGYGDPDPSPVDYSDDRTDEQRASDEAFVQTFYYEVEAAREARHVMDALFGEAVVPF